MEIFEMELGGKPLVIETGRIAQLANGSCLVKYGETAVLVTATASKEPREGMDFFPLSVDYEERMYAVGKIPGGFIKREGRPTENAILTCRLIDRPIRPLFPDGYRNSVQVVATAMSVDQECSPEIAAMIGTSVALSISDIPFDGPIGGIKLGMIDGEYVVNPGEAQLEDSLIDLTVAGTKDAVLMLEAGANEASEDIMLDAILYAHEEIKKIVTFIEGIVEKVNKPKMEAKVPQIDEDLRRRVKEYGGEKIKTAIKTFDKQERMDKIGENKEEILGHFLEQYENDENLAQIQKDIKSILKEIEKHHLRQMIVHENVRPDDRKTDEIRPISCDVGVLPKTHGSGLFTRGQTQVLTTATLGAVGEVQIIDGLGLEESRRYMHHYNFPPYSVGETGFMRGPGRREIGHGALAGRALEPMIPTKEEFPYTLRLVSEVVASNGSTSQASVCGSTLSLLDAGVPLKKMVAGIAMGLMREDDTVAVLSDIQGMEDFLGDMDFKVAGTEDGITAMQMDMKIAGITKEILKEALEQARIGRLHILGEMQKVISEPRPELSPYAPRILQMKIHPDKIREVIGAGGKVINKIIDETGVKIDIEDDGSIYIAAENAEAGKEAMQIIENIIKDPEIGETYMGKVVKITNFGAFMEILPGKEGLLHVSNIAHERVNKVEDVLEEGQEMEVKVIDIDKSGKVSLSRKALLKKEDKFKK